MIQSIEETITRNLPENYYDQLIPAPGHVSLADCEFPDSITDPLRIIRHVQGEERAQWLAYEDDLEIIAQEIEICIRKLKSTGACDVEGDEEGEESNGGQAVARQ